MKIYEHECEILTVQDTGPQALIQLCGLLNHKSAEGCECITVLPIQVGRPSMQGKRLVTQPQPAFAVVLRKEKQPVEPERNGKVVLDRE